MCRDTSSAWPGWSEPHAMSLDSWNGWSGMVGHWPAPQSWFSRAPMAKLDLLSLELLLPGDFTRARILGKQPQSCVRLLGCPRHCRQMALTFPILLFLIWDLLGRPKHLFMDTKDNDSWLKFLASEVSYVETRLFFFFKTKIFSQIFSLLLAFGKTIGSFQNNLSIFLLNLPKSFAKQERGFFLLTTAAVFRKWSLL